MGHGSGGRMGRQLIADLFRWAFANPILDLLDDQAVLNVSGGRIAFSTDAFVVSPIRFPGGNIGDLAINGTVNDLAMSGALPKWLACSFILEEGLLITELGEMVASMKAAAAKAGVQIVTGDTKVVARGQADKLFIATTGIGVIEHPYTIGANMIKPGDAILLSGTLADHGIAVLSQREGYRFETTITSDSAPLHELVQAMLTAGGEAVHAMRDPTRGGLAAALNELAHSSGVGMEIDERAIPINPPVQSACELFGFDPLTIANEGKLVAFVAPSKAEAVLSAMRSDPVGAQAVKIGEVVRPLHPLAPVVLRTRIGGKRIIDVPLGEPLPRIC